MAQRSLNTIEFTVEETKAFYEILLGRDISANIVSSNIFVAEDSLNFVEWKYDRLQTNSWSDALVYDEFYHFTDQIGIRFGNGVFGRIPPVGSIVLIEMIDRGLFCASEASESLAC